MELWYMGILDSIGIPPSSNYVDADTIRRLEHANKMIDEYWTINGWNGIYSIISQEKLTGLFQPYRMKQTVGPIKLIPKK